MKKVLLSSVVALAVFAAAAPAVSAKQVTQEVPAGAKVFYKDGVRWIEYKGTTQIFPETIEVPDTPARDLTANPGKVNPDRPTDIETNVTYVRATVKDVQGNPVAGAVVDIFDGENYHTGTTDANGDFAVRAKAGLVAKARVANAPAGYFVPGYLSAPKSQPVVAGQMYTNIELVVEKTATYNVPGQKTVTPGSDNGSTNEATNEAKKTEQGAKAAQNGKAASAQAGKALPKTSAVK